MHKKNHLTSVKKIHCQIIDVFFYIFDCFLMLSKLLKKYMIFVFFKNLEDKKFWNKRIWIIKKMKS